MGHIFQKWILYYYVMILIWTLEIVDYSNRLIITCESHDAIDKKAIDQIMYGERGDLGTLC